MPNHISNRLTITGGAEEVAKVFASLEGEEKIIDFNTIIPMPEILKSVGRGFSTIEGERVTTWWTDNILPWGDPNRKPDRLLTDQELADISAIGFKDWYDWSRANWGTKWNAYQQLRLSDSSICFQTAWSAPFPVIKALAEKFPAVRITLEYADEAMGSNAGIVRFADGGKIGRAEFHGSEAIKVWLDINKTSPEEYGYDPVTFKYIGDEAA